MLHADVVVVGAGLAGAATAHALARAGADVLVLERESLPGFHASGRNAAMVRQLVAPSLLPVVLEGARFLRAGFDDVNYRRCGSLLLALGTDAARLRAALPRLHEQRVDASWIGPREVAARVPLMSGAVLDGAVHTTDDGVVDVAALLRAFLRGPHGRKPRLLLDRTVVGVQTEHGSVTGVVTSAREHIATPVVVNAAGAWARSLARLADAADIPLRVTRRHLMLTALIPDVDAEWPIVWDESHAFYFRPESGALLLSPCDETDDLPGIPALSSGAFELLARKLTSCVPRLASRASIRRAWAGLRTLTPDGNVVVGEDPRVRGFIWCAGLGGHGVAACAAVGRLAAAAARGTAPPAEHAAARFAPSYAGRTRD